MTADDLPAVFESVPPAWARLLPGWTKALFEDVRRRVEAVSGGRPIAPADPLRALRLLAPEAVRVVIIGQDPYPTAGHADGLAFSCGLAKPPSLRRIFDVLEADRPDFRRPAVWSLDHWARQGVLLLNPTLTVEVGVAGSHMQCGWQALTSQVVGALCRRESPPTFLLWGKPAGRFFDASCSSRAEVRALRARHPSYDFKRQFMSDGSHFVATRQLLDWWAADPASTGHDIFSGSSRRGGRVVNGSRL